MNSFFQCKQFTIQQDKCAMKVCTDACLFGAYMAYKLAKEDIDQKRLLDIGAGTGLLSLMLAQKNDIEISAVEIDINAYKQAKQNILEANFKNKIEIFHTDILIFSPNKKYDFIICNPPFFENQLKSTNDDRNTAMHATTLSFILLIKAIKKLLSEQGSASLLLPFYAVEDFTKMLAIENLFVLEKVNVKHSPPKNFFRTILTIGFEEKIIIEKELSIKDDKNDYSSEFTYLLKDYYLKL